MRAIYPAPVYVRLYGTTTKKIVATREVYPGVNVDFDAEGNAVGVEVLNGNTVTVDGEQV